MKDKEILIRFFVSVSEKISYLRSKRPECADEYAYESFTMDLFFSYKVAELLESALGMTTVRDLVDVDPRRLLKVVMDFSKMDKEEFWKSFATLYQFFKIHNMLSTLKKRDCPYKRFPLGFFFGPVLSRLLESTLGMTTVQDLVNVQILSLFEHLVDFYEEDFLEVQTQSFYSYFDVLYDFFESY